MTRRPWRESEDAYICEQAGYEPLSSIAAHLRRTKGAVRTRACELRKTGALGTSLRYYEPKTRECPECHELRSQFYRNGTCKVCNLERLVRSHKDTAFELWRTLEPDYQSRTLSGSPHSDADHEEVLSFVKGEQPKRPSVCGMTDYMARKTLDGYYVAFEAWKIGVLERQIIALKGREHRWRKHQKKQ